MGIRNNYKCEECGYHAMVSGGMDMGFNAITHTIACNDCKTLHDIKVGENDAILIGDINLDGHICPKCHSGNIELWGFIKKEDKKIISHNFMCPKCGGVMLKGGERIYWD